jgi:oligopeptidase A
VLGTARHLPCPPPLAPPQELFSKLKAAKTYRSASMMLRQLHFSSVDLELHAR